MAKYRFVGNHADQLADGRPVAPGEFVNLSDEEMEDPHNAMLATDGHLIGTGSKSTETVEELQEEETRRLKREGKGAS